VAVVAHTVLRTGSAQLGAYWSIAALGTAAVVAGMAGLLRIVERSGERRFEALVRQSSDLVVVLDEAGVVTFASPSIRAITGVDPTGLAPEETLGGIHVDDIPALVDQLLQARTGAPVPVAQARLRRHDGEWRHVEVVLTDLRDDADVGGIVLTARDATDRIRLEEELRRQAFHDPLTGLPNRALLLDRIGQAITRTARTGHPVALVFCDLDDFKTVNDSLGHRAGDELLDAIAGRLQACVRPGDTAARLGGDEFAVLLDGVADADHALEVAHRILDRLRAPLEIGDTVVAGVASIGVAVATPGHGAAELLRDADTAMYESKSRGKGRVTLYEPAMHAVALQRLRLKSDLRDALAAGQHRVEYQPIVQLRTGRPVAVEALVRWDHPDLGAIPPERFVALAEESGAIHELGAWVLRSACAEVAGWDRRTPLRLDLAVNVSPRQLTDPALPDVIAAACRDTGLAAGRLVLELTEGELVDRLDEARDVLDAIRDLGVRIAIDDFGTGSSSLAYLHRLPVDEIKVDKTFIDHLDGVSAHATLTRGIVELTKALGVTTVAEGIESPRQVAELIRLGCERGQGFHFARPLGGPQVLDLLTAWDLRPGVAPSPTRQAV
jgi:diguanylate cyclase (GGDEF)-like protein/PAS domain S-box-containing protein